MGVGAAATAIGVGVNAIAGAGEANAQQEAAESKQAALQVENKELTLQDQQSAMATYDNLNKLLQTQEAQAVAKGVSVASPSVEAIQDNSLTVAARKIKNQDLETKIQQANNLTEINNTKQALNAQLFGDAGNFAGNTIKLMDSTPVAKGDA